MRKSHLVVDELTPEEAEAKMGVYPSAFDDYNVHLQTRRFLIFLQEMVIQYGYCILYIYNKVLPNYS